MSWRRLQRTLILLLTLMAAAGPLPLSGTTSAQAHEGGGGGEGGGHGGDDGDDGDDGHGGSHGRNDPSVGRFVDMVNSHGGVATATEDGSGIQVRYSDGWTETVSGDRYTLRDRRKAIVLSRPARSLDYRRLRAILR